MKSFLTAHDRPLRKTHDLDQLATVCVEIDASLLQVLDRSRDLSVFAWEFRYPGDSEVPSEAETKTFLTIAKEVYESVLSRLPLNYRKNDQDL